MIEDLISGYRAGVGTRLVDAEGRRVASIPGVGVHEGRDPSEGPAVVAEEGQDLCEALLLLARSHFIECEVLRKRLGRVEEERDISNRIAEDLYGFFRTARRIVRRGGSRGTERSGPTGSRRDRRWRRRREVVCKSLIRVERRKCVRREVEKRECS